MTNSTKTTEALDLSSLKRHRKQQNISVQAVADGMKVSKNYIHYIESAEFEKLGAPTFVRGHITNYCKVTGIEPDSILAQVPDEILQHQQLKTSDAMGSSPLSHVRRQSNHFGRYAIGTALLGMLGMSFYFIWDKWSLPGDSALDQDLSISQQDTESDGSKKITYSSLIPQVSGPNFNVDQSSDELSDSQANGELPSASDDQVMEDNADDTENASSEEINELQTPDLSAATNSTINDVANYSIVMQFEEQAWVSIKTLDGEFIVQDLLGPGLEQFEVSEPVHFRIGNAQKMQLSINDDSVELAPLTNKDIADFAWPLEPNS